MALRKRALNNKREVRAEVWRLCGGVCHHCGADLDPFTNFHLDHLIPLCEGGPDDESNLVGSCVSCNQTRPGRGTRKAQNPDTFRKEELREFRKRMGYSQIELAQVLGLTQNTISRWEKGTAPIGSPVVLRLAMERLAQLRAEEVRELGDGE